MEDQKTTMRAGERAVCVPVVFCAPGEELTKQHIVDARTGSKDFATSRIILYVFALFVPLICGNLVFRHIETPLVYVIFILLYLSVVIFLECRIRGRRTKAYDKANAESYVLCEARLTFSQEVWKYDSDESDSYEYLHEFEYIQNNHPFRTPLIRLKTAISDTMTTYCVFIKRDNKLQGWQPIMLCTGNAYRPHKDLEIIQYSGKE